MLGQFNIQKLVSSMKESGSKQPPESSWLKNLGKHVCDKSLYALGFCSEFSIGPDDTLLLSSELYGDKKSRRNKAVFHHKASGVYFFVSSDDLFISMSHILVDNIIILKKKCCICTIYASLSFLSTIL